MRVFDLLQLLDEELAPERCKIHLATDVAGDKPLDIYLEGRFREWQNWQNKRNFQREFVIAFISLKYDYSWLFAGAYSSLGSKWEGDHFQYDLKPRPACAELEGRLIAQFRRSGRQSYLLGEKWADQLQVLEIRPEPMVVEEFPGYASTSIMKNKLDIIVRQGIESWRSALSSVAGVYLISDSASGRFYVGSAVGQGGIWNRWFQYSVTGHGGNRELKDLLEREGPDYSQHFRFTILEIADTHASEEDVVARESYWKTVLLTREHGYNAN